LQALDARYLRVKYIVSAWPQAQQKEATGKFASGRVPDGTMGTTIVILSEVAQECGSNCAGWPSQFDAAF